MEYVMKYLSFEPIDMYDTHYYSKLENISFSTI